MDAGNQITTYERGMIRIPGMQERPSISPHEPVLGPF